MIGNNPEAAKFSGIKADKYFYPFHFKWFVLINCCSFFIRKIIQRKANIALGWGLVITMVVWRGLYLWWYGSIIGFFICLILGMVSFGLSLLNIPGVGIIIFTGLLLILTVSVTSFVKKFYQNKIS